LPRRARRESTFPTAPTTEYVNTIPVDQQPKYPGNADLEIRIHNYIRWNAMAMVVRANRDSNVGGHIASFASAAALYDVGFSWFWRAPSEQHGGDLIFFQGHSVPGVYARAHLLGRLTDEQMDCFRQEVDGKGVSSYPHPWLMPDFWQFPTVSMGLGPIQAIYQARFMKYLDSRGFMEAGDRKVWAFLGDGETDEVESLGAIGMAARERLDNLIFVINCNLQRLDGPVRGNGKIIQELEGTFRGAGWNVIKLIWGTHWDALFLRDKKGILKKRMMEASTASTRPSRPRTAPTSASTSSTPRNSRNWSPTGPTTTGLGAEPRRPRHLQDLQRLQERRRAQGAADADPRQDDQGLRHGPGGRGDEHLAPAEEARLRRDQALPRPLQPAGAGRPDQRSCRTSSSPRVRPN
jgi:transketolase N-terminal domain/subunit